MQQKLNGAAPLAACRLFWADGIGADLGKKLNCRLVPSRDKTVPALSCCGVCELEHLGPAGGANRPKEWQFSCNK